MVLINQVRTRLFGSPQRRPTVPTITLALPGNVALEDGAVLRAVVEFACDVMAFASVELQICEHPAHNILQPSERSTNP